MSAARAAVASQDRILVVSPVVRGTLLDLVLKEVQRVDKARDMARRHRVGCLVLDKRAAALRGLAAELAR